MSWPMQITPTMALSGPKRGAALSRKMRGSWLAVDINTSKVGKEFPLNASSKMRWVSSLDPCSTSLRNLLLIATSFCTPVTSTTRRFQSVTRPARSMPMMGALAVSTMFCNSAATRMASDFWAWSSVMSWPTPMTPTNSPSAPQRGVALKRMSRSSPCLEYKTSSKSFTTFPLRAVSSMSWTSSCCVVWMKSPTKRRPAASS
mmetsp:Transcript_20559/g.54829  ORF Transcript_20559/g.54829 Transcript_20559/m.54829 type:complete len:202 (-) Transcript_20559:1050-1655(-)